MNLQYRLLVSLRPLIACLFVAAGCDGGSEAPVDGGGFPLDAGLVDAGQESACVGLPDLSLHTTADLLETRLAVVCWLQIGDTSSVEDFQGTGLGVVRLRGVATQVDGVPSDFSPYGSHAGIASDLAIHAYRFETEAQKTIYCSVGLSGPQGYKAIESAAEIFYGQNAEFYIELSSAGYSGVRSSFGSVAAGLALPGDNIHITDIVSSVETECGMTFLHSVSFDGVSCQPGVTCEVSTKKKLLLVAARTSAQERCSDQQTRLDYMLSSDDCK